MEVCVEKGNCRGKRANFAYVDDSVERQLARLKVQEMIRDMVSEDMDSLKELADWIKGEEIMTAAERRLSMCERDRG